MEIIISNLNALGIVALCMLTFAWSLRTIKVGWQRQTIGGIAFGVGAIVSMLEPILIVEGYRADARYLFVSLISAFGGGIAALIATSLAILARLAIGGQGTVIGVTCTALSALLAGYWGLATRSTNKRGVGHWITLSFIAAFPIALGFITIYPSAPYPAFVRGLFATISIFIFGKLMEAEKRRAIRESELDKAAGLDFLTQLPNRRALHAFLSSPDMHRENGRAFLAIDIDHFKAINDKYGHQIGDNVLKLIGHQLKSSIREGDFAARTGGEEFAVIIQVSSLEEGKEIAEGLRESLCVNFEAGGSTIPVTASLGGVFVFGKVVAAEALHVADQALYDAKRSGRNQTHFVGAESFELT